MSTATEREPTDVTTAARMRVCKICRFSTTDSKTFLHHQMLVHGGEGYDHNQFSDSSIDDHSDMDDFQTGNYQREDIESSPQKINGNVASDREDNDEGNSIFHRKYSCSACDLTTTNAKLYLYHLKDKHGHDILIYECKKCSYATRYKQKLHRHEAAHVRRESDDVKHDAYNSSSIQHDGEEENENNHSETSTNENHDQSLLHKPDTTNNDKDSTDERKQDPTINTMSSGDQEGCSDSQGEYVEETLIDSQDKSNKVSEWADNNRIDDEEFRNQISVPTHTIPPLDESESEEEGALVIAEDESADKNNRASSESSSSVSYVRTSPQMDVGDSGEQPVKKKRPPRQEIDPNKYKEILDEEGKVKFACTVCGSAYTWKKSLSKHWKEKHDDSKPASPASNPTLIKQVRSPSLTPQLASRLNHDHVIKSATPPMTYTPINIPCYIQPRPVLAHGKHPIASTTQHLPFGRPDIHSAMAAMYREPSFADKDVYGNPFTEVLHQKSKALLRQTTVDQPIDLSIKREPEDVAPYGLQLYNGSESPLDFTVTKGDRGSVKFNADGFPESSASLQCSKCGQVSTNFEEFSRHMESHLTKRGHNCAECRTKFKTSEDLNRHFSEIHREKILDTAQVAITLDRNSQHSKLEVSQNEDSLVCSHCDFVAKWPTELQKHVMVHSTERPFVCMVCSADYKWKWDLVKHFDKTHHSLPNPYRKREHSPHHKLQAHGESPEPARKRKPSEVKHAITDEDPPFMCSVCGYHCKFQFQMVLHMRETHQSGTPENTNDNNRNVDLNRSAGRSELKINIPRRYFDSEDEMEMELSEMEMPLSSPGTHASASVRESLKQHLNQMKSQPNTPTLSPGDKWSSADILLPYKCSLCEYRARWPSEITQHMKNHSDEKPYLCPRCSYKSKWKWDVVKHLKRCGGGTIKDVIDTTRNKMPKYQRSSLPRSVPVGQMFISVPPPTHVNALTPPPAHSGHNLVKDNREHDSEQSITTLTSHSPSHSNIPLAHTVTHSNTRSPPLAAVEGPARALFSMSLGLMPVQKSPKLPEPVPLEMPPSPPEHIRVNPNLTSGGNIVKYGQDSQSEQESPYGQPAVATSALLAQLDSAPVGYQGKSFQTLAKEGFHHCCYCAFVASSPAELRRHLILHSEEKPFRCDSCEYQTKWKCDLKKHVQAYAHVTSTKFVARSKVGRTNDANAAVLRQFATNDLGSYNPKDSMSQMENPQKSLMLRCESCDYMTHKRHLLDSHQKIHEKPGQLQTNKYKCKQCHFRANDLPSFLQHKVEHSNQQAHRMNSGSPASVNEEEVKITDNSHSPKHGKSSRKPTKKVYCSLCPFACVDHTRMEYHGERHIHLGAFACSFCSFSVNDREELEGHMRIHPEFTRIHEPSPGTEAAAVAPLHSDGYHTTRKGNRKLYQCKKCPYSNESHGNIARHVEKHGKHSKYKCPKCDYSLDRLNLLLQHTRGVHGIHDADKVWLNYSNFMQSVSQLKDKQRHPKQDVEDRSPQLEVQKHYQISENPRNLPVRGGAMQVVFRGVKQKVYRCPKCPYKSKKEMNCFNHIKMHGGKGSFMCSLCDYCSSKMELVKRHMENIHEQMDAPVLINKTQTNMQSVEYPLASDETDLCDMSLPQLSPKPDIVEMTSPIHEASPQLNDFEGYDKGMVTPRRPMMSPFHSRPKSGSPGTSSPKLRRCEICPYAVKGRLPFERHMECHKKDGRYTCKHCNYSLDRLNLLYQHMQLHGDMSRDIPSINKSSSGASRRKKIFRNPMKITNDHEGTFVPFTVPNREYLDQQFESEQALLRKSLEAKTEFVSHNANIRSEGVTYENATTSVFPEREVATPRNRNEFINELEVEKEQTSLPIEQRAAVDISEAFTEQSIKDADYDNLSSDIFSCPECPFIANDDEECEKHYSFHVNRYKYQCDYCTFSHDKTNLLYQHRKLHSDNEGFDPSPSTSELELKIDTLEASTESNNGSFDTSNPNTISDDATPKDKDSIQDINDKGPNDCELISPSFGEPNGNQASQDEIKTDDKHNVPKTDDVGEIQSKETRSRRSSSRSTTRDRASLDSYPSDVRPKSLTATGPIQHGTVYCCEECPYLNNNKANYLNHSERHKKRSKFPCPYCTYSTGRQNQCLNHTKLHFPSDSDFDIGKISAKIAELSESGMASNESAAKRKRTRSGNDR